MLPLSYTGPGNGPVERRKPLSRAGAFPGGRGGPAHHSQGLWRGWELKGQGKTQAGDPASPCPWDRVCAAYTMRAGEVSKTKRWGRVRGAGPRAAAALSFGGSVAVPLSAPPSIE